MSFDYPKIEIEIDQSTQNEQGEKLEEKLRDAIQEAGFTGKIHNEETGNELSVHAVDMFVKRMRRGAK